jgi:hypothetical protein
MKFPSSDDPIEVFARAAKYLYANHKTKNNLWWLILAPTLSVGIYISRDFKTEQLPMSWITTLLGGCGAAVRAKHDLDREEKNLRAILSEYHLGDEDI